MLLAAFTAGCGNQVEKKVEKGIAKSLPDIIGPARSYDVHVTGSSLSMVKGKLSTMQILGQDVHLPNGIVLARLTVLSRDIAFDTGSRTLKHVQGTDFTAVLSEAELNRYLKKAYSSVPELKVELVPAIIRICARPTIAGLGPGIVAEAALKVRDRRLIMLDFDSIRVGGLGTPRPARDYVESKVNPVFDVSDIGYNASVGSVAIGKRQLSLSGSLDLMAANKKK